MLIAWGEMKVDTQSILAELRNTRFALVRWKQYAYRGLFGAKVGDKTPPLDPEECRFGKWFQDKGAELIGHHPHFHALCDTHVHLREQHRRIQEHLHSDEIEHAREQWKHFVETFRHLLDTMIALEQALEAHLHLQPEAC